MISSADFTRSSSGAARWHAQQTRGGPPAGASGGAADSCWGDLMAAAGEVSWPPAGSLLAAYGEILMAADTPRRCAGVWCLVNDDPDAAGRGVVDILRSGV